MPTVRLEIEPQFLGPMSFGTVSLIRALKEELGLTLKESKDVVDRCVFDEQPAMFHVATVAAGTSLCQRLSNLGAPALVRAIVKSANPAELRQPSSPSAGAPPTFLAPDRDSP